MSRYDGWQGFGQWSYRLLLLTWSVQKLCPSATVALRASRAPSSVQGHGREAHQILGIGSCQLAPYLICQLCQELLPRVVLNLGQAPQQIRQVAGSKVAPLGICTRITTTLRLRCWPADSYCARAGLTQMPCQRPAFYLQVPFAA